MGRSPCCEKVGIKKGPWRPEEDIILVSYIHEHGPGNWHSVPINTCLMRCGKSCRLRWTNYLRPGIRRGNFTPNEEDIIVRLQSLLGNKWATIASYLPQRTDNDIKNYWNNSLKRKLNKQQIGAISTPSRSRTLRHTTTTTNSSYSSSSSYAFSTDNISKLLRGFMRSSPTQSDDTDTSVLDNNPLFRFDHMSGGAVLPPPISNVPVPPLMLPPSPHQQLSSIEDWLFDMATNKVVDQLMEISDGCCSFPVLL